MVRSPVNPLDTAFPHEWRKKASRPVEIRRVLELGPREAALLGALWRHGESTVNELYEKEPSTTVCVNTVHSTLERLYRKGFVNRSRQGGRSYKYWPVFQKSELVGLCVQALADRLAGGDQQQIIDGFNHYLASLTAESPTRSNPAK